MEDGQMVVLKETRVEIGSGGVIGLGGKVGTEGVLLRASNGGLGQWA